MNVECAHQKLKSCLVYRCWEMIFHLPVTVYHILIISYGVCNRVRDKISSAHYKYNWIYVWLNFQVTADLWYTLRSFFFSLHASTCYLMTEQMPSSFALTHFFLLLIGTLYEWTTCHAYSSIMSKEYGREISVLSELGCKYCLRVSVFVCDKRKPFEETKMWLRKVESKIGKWIKWIVT